MMECWRIMIFKYSTVLAAASKGWDGTIKGQPADMGNYIWIATFKKNNEPFN